MMAFAIIRCILRRNVRELRVISRNVSINIPLYAKCGHWSKTMVDNDRPREGAPCGMQPKSLATPSANTKPSFTA